MKTHALLMAAGESQRFSGVKQLAQISGQSMINYCLNNYMIDQQLLPELDGLTLVLGANANLIKKQLIKPLASNINTIEVKEWQKGMGRSISVAIVQLESDVSHVLIGLADQIAVTNESFRLLLKTSKNHPNNIIAANYANKIAVPVIFPCHYFAQLTALSGDLGARNLLQTHYQQAIHVEMPEAGIDIDTKLDLNNWLKICE